MFLLSFLLAASFDETIENTTLIEKKMVEIPSYCFNISDPTIHDTELEDLRRQLIFWVEGEKYLLPFQIILVRIIVISLNLTVDHLQ